MTEQAVTFKKTRLKIKSFITYPLQLFQGKRPLWESFTMLLLLKLPGLIVLEYLSKYINSLDPYDVQHGVKIPSTIFGYYSNEIALTLGIIIYAYLIISVWRSALNVKKYTVFSFISRAFVMYVSVWLISLLSAIFTY